MVNISIMITFKIIFLYDFVPGKDLCLKLAGTI